MCGDTKRTTASSAATAAVIRNRSRSGIPRRSLTTVCGNDPALLSVQPQRCNSPNRRTVGRNKSAQFRHEPKRCAAAGTAQTCSGRLTTYLFPTRLPFVYVVPFVVVPCLIPLNPSLPTEPPAFIGRFPPFIGMIAPVIQDEASDARKTTRPVMSFVLPKRPAGMPLRKRSLMRGSASIRCCKPGFNTWASKIELTRTPRPLHCNAHEITSSFRAVAVDWN